MSDILSKPVDDISWIDVESMCRDRVAESQTLELKSAVPDNRKASIGWAGDNPRLSDYSKRELVKEIVALANSHGGHIIIGIKESSDNPPCADGIENVEACGDLQIRLESVVRDLIEPQLFGVRLRAIESPNRDGTGVIIVRIPPSTIGPHRSKCDWQVYSRTGTISAPLSMRDVQDRTLHVRSAQRAVEARLDERRFANLIPAPVGFSVTSAIRATAVPSTRLLSVPRPYRLSFSDLPPPKPIVAEIDGETCNFDLPRVDYWNFRTNAVRRRPCLRGALLQLYRHSPAAPPASQQLDRRIVCTEEEILEDGLVELRYYNLDIRTERDDVSEWTVLGMTSHVLLTAERLRTMVGIPGAEYTFEVEVKIWPVPELDIEGKAPRPFEQSFILPRMVLEERGIAEALRSVFDDLMNMQGIGHSESFQLLKMN